MLLHALDGQNWTGCMAAGVNDPCLANGVAGRFAILYSANSPAIKCAPPMHQKKKSFP